MPTFLHAFARETYALMPPSGIWSLDVARRKA
jgi:hypothetical protein